ncbi:hypothetical protein ABR737_25100 [Streptomyces sp. Edi2]|uniref:hypothetical protein n=1 Tax=Streptomyces sp. Edi2 TaxID=3162528 RepID=UPI0033062C01
MIHCPVDFLGEFGSVGYGNLADLDSVIIAPDLAIVARIFDFDIGKVNAEAPECVNELAGVIFGLFPIAV